MQRQFDSLFIGGGYSHFLFDDDCEGEGEYNT